MYTSKTFGCIFYITLEAMEEDVAGVYVATVLCKSADGESTLIKFIRSPRAPVGKFKPVMLITIRFFSYCIQVSFLCTRLKRQQSTLSERKNARWLASASPRCDNFDLCTLSIG